MPCFKPLQAFRTPYVNRITGKSVISFKAMDTALYVCEPLKLPCGQCIGCRMQRSRDWAIRCVHEASLYTDNCFITLTYSNEHLPKDGSLNVRVFQLFMKRLRRKFGNGIRFYMCGEYGDRYGRPHYHACLFGFDFPDKQFWKMTKGLPLYRSPSLEKLWKFGFSSIGSVTFESAAYVARYIHKKITGDKAKIHYANIDYDTGEILSYRKPEFNQMSRGCKSLGTGGIAKGWFDQFKSDVYPNDVVVYKGKELKPPRFYDNCYEVENPESFVKIKESRLERAKLIEVDNTKARLLVKETLQKLRASKLVRVLDMEL